DAFNIVLVQRGVTAAFKARPHWPYVIGQGRRPHCSAGFAPSGTPRTGLLARNPLRFNDNRHVRYSNHQGETRCAGWSRAVPRPSLTRHYDVAPSPGYEPAVLGGWARLQRLPSPPNRTRRM